MNLTIEVLKNYIQQLENKLKLEKGDLAIARGKITRSVKTIQDLESDIEELQISIRNLTDGETV